jgi:hypothetical protein
MLLVYEFAACSVMKTGGTCASASWLSWSLMLTRSNNFSPSGSGTLRQIMLKYMKNYYDTTSIYLEIAVVINLVCGYKF